MKIYIISSDKYAFLLNVHVTFINKYYPGQDITILAYDLSKVPKIESNNVKIVSLGTQSRVWTDPLLKYFKNCEEEYFIIGLDDLILIDHVDVNKVKILKDYILSGHAKKAVLGNWLFNRSTVWEKDSNILRVNDTATYRLTLHPAIWTKEYFMRYLKPDFDIWQFELRNYQETTRDKETIIALNEPVFENHVYDVVNVFSRGRVAPPNKGMEYIKPKDRELIIDVLNREGYKYGG